MTPLDEQAASVTETEAGQELITYRAVHLDVVDAARSLGFWRDLVGLELLERSDEALHLGAGDRELIVLHRGAVRGVLRGHAGLYHVAIHLPNAEEFARAIARFAARRVPQAPTDHVFSKATYLRDPDGIGLELTLETPERFGSFEIGPERIVIRDSDGRERGGTEPLDVDEALAPLRDREYDRPLPAGATVGHVHLHVPDLEAGWRFYRDVIGFREHMFMPGIGMADLGAGGRFPHRLAMNVWQGPGATQPPPGTAGLRRFELAVRPGEVSGIGSRLETAGIPFEPGDRSLLARDPAGNAFSVVEQAG